jgi:2-oxoglutarate ferredoxin oxidoreductase subunit beta
VYEPAGHDPGNFDKACALAREWDYNTDARIALGVVYRKSMPGFGERIAVPGRVGVEREKAIDDFLASRI